MASIYNMTDRSLLTILMQMEKGDRICFDSYQIIKGNHQHNGFTIELNGKRKKIYATSLGFTGVKPNAKTVKIDWLAQLTRDFAGYQIQRLHSRDLPTVQQTTTLDDNL